MKEATTLLRYDVGVRRESGGEVIKQVPSEASCVEEIMEEVDPL